MDTSSWTRVTSERCPPYLAFQKPIEKSLQDDRDYRLIQLDNGLKALLVHDSKADNAAASLDVAVGHLFDPDDMPGLAHFCEHLLFMGTEQFPRENEYSEFLAKNNGASNAFTSTSNTNYYFHVATPALIPALTRFACFFHSPLFLPSCTSRELNAVDSEHKKNFQNDIWRIYQVNKHTSREGHVWRKFGTGSRASLSQAAILLKEKERVAGKLSGRSSKTSSAVSSPIPSRMPSPGPPVMLPGTESAELDGGFVSRETRRRLVEWWSQEYCASRMRLCVIGNESLDDLGDLVSSLFSPVKNRGREPLPMFNEHPFGPNEKGTVVCIQTIMSFHAVEISFPLGYQPPLWRYKPANFISFFTGHEGPGSLHSYLKDKHWITSLSAGTHNLARGFAMYKLMIHLTSEGFLNYRSVIMAAFKYISLLRSSPFPAWCQREQAMLSAIRFRFAEKRKPHEDAASISERMAWPVPPELLISASHLVWEWDEGDDAGEEEVRKILDGLRVDQGRALLMARADEHAKICGDTVQWEKEPWYGTPYRVERFDEEFIKEANGPNDIPEFRLPGPNKFVPSNLDVDKREVSEPLKRPRLVHKTPISALWYKKDDRFWVPKAHVSTEIQTPFANDSGRLSVMTRLYVDLVNDSLTESVYDADLAGLKYSISASRTGVCVFLSGYNDKMAAFCKYVIQQVKNLIVDPERLQVMKEQLKRDWTNFFMGQSSHIADHHMRYTLSEKEWTIPDVLPQIDLVTAEGLQAHIETLLSRIHIIHLITGNLSQNEAIDISDSTEKILGSSALPSRLYKGDLTLAQGNNVVWTSPVPNAKEPNSALSYYLQVGRITDQRNRVVLTLLAQILAEPAFNVLRTKEQLGYVVACTMLSGAVKVGLRILVQSEKKPAYLEERVEAFLDQMKSIIEEMKAEQFLEQKLGLERKWREAEKNLAEETTNYWTQLDSGHLDFYRRENDANLLQDISKDEVFTLFMTHVHPSSSVRAKVSIHLLSQKPPPLKISIAAIEKFEEMVRNSSFIVHHEAYGWRGEHGSDGPLSLLEFGKHWQNALGSQNGAQGLLQQIPTLVQAHPVQSEEVAKREDVTYIKNLQEFKASLKVAEVELPLVEWGDMPIAKF